MRFALTEEQEALRDTARRFLAERMDIREQIQLPGGHDPELWRAIIELGWLGDLGLVETALLVEEAGRALLPGPFLGTLMAGTHTIVAPALTGGDSTIRFVRNRIRGEHRLVPCAAVADSILVETAGPALFLVRARDCDTEPVKSVDLTRPAAHVRFEGVPVDTQIEPRNFFDRARVLIAAEMIGGADATLTAAVAYAKERIQFDRPIGSFQAIKHKAADAWRALESARFATWYAAWALENDAGDARFAASAAKAAAGDAFIRCAGDSIQIHGGIGFTWEHDAHLFYRRAIADQAWLGDSSTHRDGIAASVLANA